MRHPVPLYDVLAQVVLLAVLVRRARIVPFDGFLFWWTLLWSSVIRFAMDLFRPQWTALGGMTLGQVGALSLIAFSAAMLLAGRRRTQAPIAGRARAK